MSLHTLIKMMSSYVCGFHHLCECVYVFARSYKNNCLLKVAHCGLPSDLSSPLHLERSNVRETESNQTIRIRTPVYINNSIVSRSIHGPEKYWGEIYLLFSISKRYTTLVAKVIYCRYARLKKFMPKENKKKNP